MTAKKKTKRTSKRSTKGTAKRARKPAKKAQPSMAARIAELKTLSTDQLRTKYREVFGEETRSRNKPHLLKKIAWRLQANEEGGLSERAKRRAAELANDADVRTRAPKGGSKKGAAAKDRTRTERFTGGSHDPRVPVPGTVLTRKYKSRGAVRV